MQGQEVKKVQLAQNFREFKPALIGTGLQKKYSLPSGSVLDPKIREFFTGSPEVATKTKKKGLIFPTTKEVVDSAPPPRAEIKAIADALDAVKKATQEEYDAKCKALYDAVVVLACEIESYKLGYIMKDDKKLKVEKDKTKYAIGLIYLQMIGVFAQQLLIPITLASQVDVGQYIADEKARNKKLAEAAKSVDFAKLLFNQQLVTVAFFSDYIKPITITNLSELYVADFGEGHQEELSGFFKIILHLGRKQFVSIFVEKKDEGKVRPIKVALLTRYKDRLARDPELQRQRQEFDQTQQSIAGITSKQKMTREDQQQLDQLRQKQDEQLSLLVANMRKKFEKTSLGIVAETSHREQAAKVERFNVSEHLKSLSETLNNINIQRARFFKSSFPHLEFFESSGVEERLGKLQSRFDKLQERKKGLKEPQSGWFLKTRKALYQKKKLGIETAIKKLQPEITDLTDMLFPKTIQQAQELLEQFKRQKEQHQKSKDAWYARFIPGYRKFHTQAIELYEKFEQEHQILQQTLDATIQKQLSNILKILDREVDVQSSSLSADKSDVEIDILTYSLDELTTFFEQIYQNLSFSRLQDVREAELLSKLKLILLAAAKLKIQDDIVNNNGQTLQNIIQGFKKLQVIDDKQTFETTLKTSARDIAAKHIVDILSGHVEKVDNFELKPEFDPFVIKTRVDSVNCLAKVNNIITNLQQIDSTFGLGNNGSNLIALIEVYSKTQAFLSSVAFLQLHEYCTIIKFLMDKDRVDFNIDNFKKERVELLISRLLFDSTTVTTEKVAQLLQEAKTYGFSDLVRQAIDARINDLIYEDLIGNQGLDFQELYNQQEQKNLQTISAKLAAFLDSANTGLISELTGEVVTKEKCQKTYKFFTIYNNLLNNLKNVADAKPIYDIVKKQYEKLQTALKDIKFDGALKDNMKAFVHALIVDIYFFFTSPEDKPILKQLNNNINNQVALLNKLTAVTNSTDPAQSAKELSENKDSIELYQVSMSLLEQLLEIQKYQQQDDDAAFPKTDKQKQYFDQKIKPQLDSLKTVYNNLNKKWDEMLANDKAYLNIKPELLAMMKKFGKSDDVTAVVNRALARLTEILKTGLLGGYEKDPVESIEDFVKITKVIHAMGTDDQKQQLQNEKENIESYLLSYFEKEKNLERYDQSKTTLIPYFSEFFERNKSTISAKAASLSVSEEKQKKEIESCSDQINAILKEDSAFSRAIKKWVPGQETIDDKLVGQAVDSISSMLKMAEDQAQTTLPFQYLTKDVALKVNEIADSVLEDFKQMSEGKAFDAAQIGKTVMKTLFVAKIRKRFTDPQATNATYEKVQKAATQFVSYVNTAVLTANVQEQQPDGSFKDKPVDIVNDVFAKMDEKALLLIYGELPQFGLQEIAKAEEEISFYGADNLEKAEIIGIPNYVLIRIVEALAIQRIADVMSGKDLDNAAQKKLKGQLEFLKKVISAQKELEKQSFNQYKEPLRNDLLRIQRIQGLPEEVYTTLGNIINNFETKTSDFLTFAKELDDRIVLLLSDDAESQHLRSLISGLKYRYSESLVMKLAEKDTKQLRKLQVNSDIYNKIKELFIAFRDNETLTSAEQAKLNAALGVFGITAPKATGSHVSSTAAIGEMQQITPASPPAEEVPAPQGGLAQQLDWKKLFKCLSQTKAQVTQGFPANISEVTKAVQLDDTIEALIDGIQKGRYIISQEMIQKLKQLILTPGVFQSEIGEDEKDKVSALTQRARHALDLLTQTDILTDKSVFISYYEEHKAQAKNLINTDLSTTSNWVYGKREHKEEEISQAINKVYSALIFAKEFLTDQEFESIQKRLDAMEVYYLRRAISWISRKARETVSGIGDPKHTDYQFLEQTVVKFKDLTFSRLVGTLSRQNPEHTKKYAGRLVSNFTPLQEIQARQFVVAEQLKALTEQKPVDEVAKKKYEKERNRLNEMNQIVEQIVSENEQPLEVWEMFIQKFIEQKLSPKKLLVEDIDDIALWIKSLASARPADHQYPYLRNAVNHLVNYVLSINKNIQYSELFDTLFLHREVLLKILPESENKELSEKIASMNADFKKLIFILNTDREPFDISSKLSSNDLVWLERAPKKVVGRKVVEERDISETRKAQLIKLFKDIADKKVKTEAILKKDDTEQNQTYENLQLLYEAGLKLGLQDTDESMKKFLDCQNAILNSHSKKLKDSLNTYTTMAAPGAAIAGSLWTQASLISSNAIKQQLAREYKNDADAFVKNVREFFSAKAVVSGDMKKYFGSKEKPEEIIQIIIKFCDVASQLKNRTNAFTDAASKVTNNMSNILRDQLTVISNKEFYTNIQSDENKKCILACVLLLCQHLGTREQKHDIWKKLFDQLMIPLDGNSKSILRYLARYKVVDYQGEIDNPTDDYVGLYTAFCKTCFGNLNNQDDLKVCIQTLKKAQFPPEANRAELDMYITSLESSTQADIARRTGQVQEVKGPVDRSASGVFQNVAESIMKNAQARITFVKEVLKQLKETSATLEAILSGKQVTRDLFLWALITVGLQQKQPPYEKGEKRGAEDPVLKLFTQEYAEARKKIPGEIMLALICRDEPLCLEAVNAFQASEIVKNLFNQDPEKGILTDPAKAYENYGEPTYMSIHPLYISFQKLFVLSMLFDSKGKSLIAVDPSSTDVTTRESKIEKFKEAINTLKHPIMGGQQDWLKRIALAFVGVGQQPEPKPGYSRKLYDALKPFLETGTPPPAVEPVKQPPSINVGS